MELSKLTISIIHLFSQLEGVTIYIIQTTIGNAYFIKRHLQYLYKLKPLFLKCEHTMNVHQIHVHAHRIHSLLDELSEPLALLMKNITFIYIYIYIYIYEQSNYLTLL